jgi:predicted CopG family antitoxin
MKTILFHLSDEEYNKLREMKGVKTWKGYFLELAGKVSGD